MDTCTWCHPTPGYGPGKANAMSWDRRTRQQIWDEPADEMAGVGVAEHGGGCLRVEAIGSVAIGGISSFEFGFNDRRRGYSIQVDWG
jgi:hypothetical protein